MRLSPLFITIAVQGVLVYATIGDSQAFPYDPGFNVRAVASQAKFIPSHSWEFGTAAEALLELYDPQYSVFGSRPFPVPTLRKGDIAALEYADEKITIGQGANALASGDGAVGDPASLGVSAYLLGKTIPKYADAAKDELNYVVNEAPRWSNGAISHRVEAPELWADFVYMAPPYIAYYAVATSNADLLREAVQQCGLYRQVLITSPLNLWHHIVGPNNADPGIWSTGNAWAAAGMTRILATVLKAPSSLITSTERNQLTNNLNTWIKEILDGAIKSPADDGLLRNYLNDTTWFGEISGSTLLASVAYRVGVLQPKVFGSKYLQWADEIRWTLGENGHVTDDGIVKPAVNPLGWGDTTPFTTGSPEGQNFVVLMYAAWRDCVNVRKCR